MTPRELAFKILRSSEKDSSYSNIAIDNALRHNELSDPDKGLLTAIVMGVTERRLTLDYIIDKMAAKPSEIDAETRIILRVGIYQLLYLDRIPSYAAVNESVELSKKKSRGFVNAILRELLRKKERGELSSLFPKREDNEAEYLSVKMSYPEGLCERFISLFGVERAEKIFEIFNLPPSLTLRINDLKISREDYAGLLRERNIEYRLSDRLENAIILENISFSSLPGFSEGYFFVQDEASQICVEALSAKEGELIIDACSCPGSKSFGSALKMNNKGKILAFDLHKSKLKLIEKSAERLGIDIITADERDGRIFDGSLENKADRVLCDVPCSGLGVMGKKPEIRYKDIKEFERLPNIQYDILENNAKYLRVGGILVYSTCTLLPEENEMNVKKFLSRHEDFAPEDFTAGGRESVGGMMALCPDTDNTDGFFIAKLKRIK